MYMYIIYMYMYIYIYITYITDCRYVVWVKQCHKPIKATHDWEW